MIVIKDMEMPKSCWNCDFCYEIDGYHCSISHNCLAKEVADLPNKNRPSNCPLAEIVTCKDCKYFERLTCLGGQCVSHTKTYINETTNDFYCADGERRENKWQSI